MNAGDREGGAHPALWSGPTLPRPAVESSGGPVEIRVGLGSCGLANDARPVWRALAKEARAGGFPRVVKAVGCGGRCHGEPLVEVVGPGGRRAVYHRVRPEQARAIVRRHLRPRRWWTRLRWALERFADAVTRRGAEAPGPVRVDGGAEPTRVVLERCGEIDPSSLEDALAHGAYRALERCLVSPPEAVIEAISASGLRGRGGAGFPTGRKWALARAGAAPRYVICNGDEGDPGAFMDRLVLESDPHRVVEGLAIAAWAIGAEEGFFYIRAEYPLAVEHVRRAIRQAEAAGYLGDGVLGSTWRIRLEVREGAGAFVCGEETALIASLEGRRGMPRLRPPYPVERGFRGRPTVINNVETLACVPWIVRHGPQAFARLGTATSRGTKVFALAGKVRRGGLIEVPMGVTLRDVVERWGGGVRGGRRLKAVQLGGPSGGCVPARLADTPIDYDSLAATGAIMGSGGLVVLDERDCMADLARYFLRFTAAESCGKCTFCRVGTRRLLEILDRLCAGEARAGDLGELAELADRVSRGSLCGLGQTAPNPVLSALEHFGEELAAHTEGRCPAGRCEALVRYRVNDACIGCTLCAQACPVAAIEPRPYERHEVDDARCTRCDACFDACRDGAVEIVSGGELCATSPRFPGAAS